MAINTGWLWSRPVAGILLLTNGVPNSDGTVNGDPDENKDPLGVK